MNISIIIKVVQKQAGWFKSGHLSVQYVTSSEETRERSSDLWHASRACISDHKPRPAHFRPQTFAQPINFKHCIYCICIYSTSPIKHNCTGKSLHLLNYKCSWCLFAYESKKRRLVLTVKVLLTPLRSLGSWAMQRCVRGHPKTRPLHQ